MTVAPELASPPPEQPRTPRGRTLRASAAGVRDLAGVGRGSRLGLLGAGFSAVANFALVLVVTHGFGRRDAGLFFSVTAAFLVVEMLCRLGTDVGSVYFIARLRSLGDSGQIAAHLRVALQPVVALCGAMVAAGLLSSGWLARNVLGAEAGRMMQVLVIALPFAVVYDICLAATRGFGTVTASTLLERLLRPGMQLMLLGVVVAFGGSTTVLAVAWSVPYLVLLPAALAVLAHLVRAEGIAQLHGEPGIARTFWSFAAPRSVTGLAQALLQRLDVVLVAVILRPSDAAIYAAASRFLVLGQLGNQALAAPVEPRLSGLLAREDVNGAKDVYRMSTAWLVGISWPVFLLASIYAPTVMRVFGPGYSSGWPVVLTLCLCMLVASGVGLVDVVLIMAGRTTWNLANTLIALVVNVGLDLILLPSVGLVGAAIGWGAAVLLTNLIPLAQIHHLMKLHPFGRSVGISVVSALAAFGAVAGGVRLALGPGFISLAAAGVIAVTLYAFLLFREREELGLHLLLGRLVNLPAGARSS